jgi:hypothetical protein
MITKKELLKLADTNNDINISIFIETHRGGKETLEGQDKINLKTELKEVKSKLEAKGMTDKEIREFTKSVSDLLEDDEFWRHQSDGLAIFITENYFKYYTVPVRFKNFNYVSNDFYLKPLMPLFNGDGLFYILSIKEDQVKFFEATRYTITELETPEIVPERLEDVVGYDHEEKSLQFRTGQQGNQGTGMYNGQGEGNAKEKNEIKRFYRAIHDGIMPLINDNQNIPLILHCQDFQWSMFNDINEYNNLMDVVINPEAEDHDMAVIHEKAWDKVKSYFQENKRQKIETYNEKIGTGKASANINDILDAAIEGKIDTLFVQNDTEIYGVFDDNKSQIEDEPSLDNTSLLNLLTINVLKKGGSSYILEKENMPDDKHKKVNAVYRY